MFDGIVVGAYAASPAHRIWDAAAEQEYFERLAAIPGIAALELPWMGGIHPHDEVWLHRHLPAAFGAVVTGIPHVMGRLAGDPAYGLASADAAGRRAAIVDVARMRDDVRGLDDAQGRSVVGVVELHAAPRGALGAADALARSLSEIASWDWGGIRLVVEHCDAWRDGQAPEKGFLSLDAELDAIEASGAPIGVSLNWGRSVIEGRSPETAAQHARAARDRGLLRGFVTSGVAGIDSPFGPAWIDAHLPFAQSPSTPHGCPGSLMTIDRVAACLQIAGPLDWAGVKVGVAGEATVAERVAVIAESAALMTRLLAVEAATGEHPTATVERAHGHC